LHKNYCRNWENKHEIQYYNKKIPDEYDIDEIVALLRPDFDVPLIEKIQYERNIQIQLTETQYDHLDQIEVNSRCLIKGAAGTGKTFIAIEAALRFGVQGKKVALFCYNTLLAEFLKGKFTDVASNIYARKFHDFGEELLRKAGIRPIYHGKDGIKKDYLDEITKLSREQDQSEFSGLIRPYPPELLGDHDFWEKTLPEKMLDALDKFPVEFDILIVDEAQDLIINGYLRVFNRILKGGLKKGSCYFFGDFTGQMVTHNPNSIEEMEELLKKYTVFYTAHPLNINCRNTKKIGEAIMQLTGIEVPEKYLRDVAEGQEVWYEQWSDMAEQKKKLESRLEKLISTEKIRRKDITILSLKPWESSVVSHITTEKIKDYSSSSIDITFSIVRRVKGLENEVIILTDIESYEGGEKIKEHLYVAMSRARSYLIIFESKNAQKERLQITGSKK
jgi:archaellum biogenesis ATPase FlaH